MEAINPNDVENLDFNTFSFITLKNGDIIMVDGSVKAKYKTNNHKNNITFSKKGTVNQALSVSSQVNFTYRGRTNFNKYNNKNKPIIIKNNFNLISRISRNISFCYKGISNNKMFLLNNHPNLPIKETVKKHSLLENNYSNFYNKENQNLNSNINIYPNAYEKENTLSKVKENNSQENNQDSSTINKNNLNIKTEEITEAEKLDMKIKRKSRNYLERLSLLFGERNKPLVNAVISLKIPSDVKRELSATEKEFDMMVTQLKQKRSKYNININEHPIYHKYYELYKDNNKEFKYLNLNRIKYYHEAENDNKENEPQINNNENNNKLELNNINNTFYGSFSNKGMNKSIMGFTDNNINNKTSNSFYGDKIKTTRDIKSLNNRIKDLGYNSTLVCPTNNFKDKLDSEL